MNSRDVKEVHERSVINSFRQYLEQAGRVLVVQGYPDPPDALVELDDKPTWVEITDAFIDKDFARSLTSQSVDEGGYVPVEGITVGASGRCFVDEVISVVMKKYDKASISKIFHRYGAGVLLVGLYSPFIGGLERNLLIHEISHLKEANDGRFAEIFLYDQDHQFYPVP